MDDSKWFQWFSAREFIKPNHTPGTGFEKNYDYKLQKTFNAKVCIHTGGCLVI